MTSYDTLRCDYPLPIKAAQQATFQTKDLCNQQDEFLLREDGTLWRTAYDLIEGPDPMATGLARVFSTVTRTNLRQEFYPYTGTLDFYTEYGAHSLERGKEGWVEFRVDFEEGRLVALHLLNHIPPAHDHWRLGVVVPRAVA
jgi:hypothetical protein